MHSDSQISNNLQCVYKAGTPTTQWALGLLMKLFHITWAAHEVISYHNNKDSSVYCCLYDCSKVFDQIKHKLLENRVAKDVPTVIIRELMFM